MQIILPMHVMKKKSCILECHEQENSEPEHWKLGHTKIRLLFLHIWALLLRVPNVQPNTARGTMLYGLLICAWGRKKFSTSQKQTWIYTIFSYQQKQVINMTIGVSFIIPGILWTLPLQKRSFRHHLKLCLHVAHTQACTIFFFPEIQLRIDE